jgi:hypothetical protein
MQTPSVELLRAKASPQPGDRDELRIHSRQPVYVLCDLQKEVCKETITIKLSKFKNKVGWGCNSSDKVPLSKQEALSSVPSTGERERENFEISKRKVTITYKRREHLKDCQWLSQQKSWGPIKNSKY